MNVVEVPLVAGRPQTFMVSLGGTLYNCRLYWLKPARHWVLDFRDISNNPLILGIPLVTGTDLAGQFRYIGLGGHLFTISTQLPPETVPDFNAWGKTGHLYFRPFDAG